MTSPPSNPGPRPPAPPAVGDTSLSHVWVPAPGEGARSYAVSSGPPVPLPFTDVPCALSLYSVMLGVGPHAESGSPTQHGAATSLQGSNA